MKRNDITINLGRTPFSDGEALPFGEEEILL